VADAAPEHETSEQEPARGRARPEVRPSLWFRVFQYTGRVLLVVVLVWIAVVTCVTYARLRSNSRLPRYADANEPDALAPPPALLADSRDGHWTFSGVLWELAMGRSKESELSSRLLAPPEQAGPRAPVVPAAREALNLVKAMGAKPSPSGEYTVYEFGKTGLRVAVFTSQAEGEERLELVRLACCEEEKGWVLIEARPCANGSPEASSGEGLLPLPPGVRRIATRRDRQRRILGELLYLEDATDPPDHFWQQHGWSIQPLEGLPDAHSRFICERGEERLHAWFYSDPNELTGILLIYRLPDE